eukprot:4194519-Pleurochrysis_carterae.AAC.1
MSSFSIVLVSDLAASNLKHRRTQSGATLSCPWPFDVDINRRTLAATSPPTYAEIDSAIDAVRSSCHDYAVGTW